MNEQQNALAPVNSNAGITQEIPVKRLSKYKPTPSQLLWLEAAIELRDDSPTKIAKYLEEMGKQLRRQNFYDWRQDPDFVEWWDQQWAKILHGIQKDTIKQVVSIGIEQAKAGRLDFLDRILELMHLRVPDAPAGSVPAAMTQINIMAEAFKKGEKERGLDADQPAK